MIAKPIEPLLKTLAASLDTASTAVVEQQKEATAKFVEMQQENLNIISQLSTALSDAKNMVDSYTSDFETLKGGMKEVFKGINDGKNSDIIHVFIKFVYDFFGA